jgi:hypothetical protein
VNFVDVSFTAGFTGNDTAMSAWFQMDGSCSTASSPGFDNRVVGDTTPSQTTLSHDMVVPVTPGVHTFRLCAFSTVGTTSQSNTLRVLTVARGSAGGTSLRPAVDSDGDIATAR